jgi:thiamine-phosphate pyrophosphorylase
MLNKLQYISQGLTIHEQVKNIHEMLDAGCTWVQLRFKNADEYTFVNAARQVKIMCASYKATLIINDHVELAKHIDADGVHLGLNDMSVAEARTILGSAKIIGGTANTLQDVLMRIEEKCDYVGLGPFRFTATKEKLSPVLGLSGYRTIMTELAAQEQNIPVIAIGGITAADIPDLLNTGIHGVAVSSGLTGDSTKKETIQFINSLLYEKTDHSR